MLKKLMRYNWVAICCVVMIVATACFRDSGESVDSQPISQLLPSDTPIPTDTPPPPTETPTPTATEASEETEEADGIVNVGNTIPGGTRVAQDSQPDDFALTATALIGQLTEDAAIILTTQAFEAGIIFDTPTPITPTFDPFLASPTPEPFVPQAGVDCVHEIRAGENLFQLSLAYGVSVMDMATRSGILNPNIVLVGQRVTIPNCGTTGFFPPPTSVPIPTAAIDPISSASVGTTTTTTTGVNSELVAQAQSALQANAGVANTAGGTGQVTATRQYTVQQYDTLFEIAQAHNTSIDVLAQLNGITNVNTIIMGQVLLVP